MLTRLKVDGFKNLAGVDVQLGPLTCVAGANGVGKSNLFDAIRFLAALADAPILEAACAVRGGDARRGDLRTLFRRVGDRVADRMSFLVEMLIPAQGEDGLGQRAVASATFLRYRLELARRDSPHGEVVEVVHESLDRVRKSETKVALPFPHAAPWRDSVISGRRTVPYISTEARDGVTVISLHADSTGQKGGGRPRPVPARGLPRTLLSSVNNAAEHRTLVLARQEMMGWTQLLLEPSALRASDDFTAPRVVSSRGAHLPKALHELAKSREAIEAGGAENLYAEVANRLSELVEDVRGLRVDVDERRQTLSIVLKDRHGTEHVAGSLSDGTLRFLALAVMEADPSTRPLLCLEEPENGMHPSRISAVMRLLSDLAVDTSLPVDDTNPLRQVIVNTHSPLVVACVDDDSLLMARASPVGGLGSWEPALELRHLPETWRHRGESDRSTITRGDLLAYLGAPSELMQEDDADATPRGSRRVAQRRDMTPYLPFQVAEFERP
jgi:predicted ATPase